MTWQRKLVFSVVTLLIFCGLVEGIGQVIWWRMETAALAKTAKKGEEILRNDAINFMKRVDGVYGYVLKPGFARGGTFINIQGFDQRDIVPVERKPGRVRLVAMGESTTQGNNTDIGNYPVYLRGVLERSGKGYEGVEVINAGVSGWVSDQIAIRAEREMVAYNPDIVVLYVGWNDFQSYDPYGPPPGQSAFTNAYGGFHSIVEGSGLKSLVLLSALYSSVGAKLETIGVRLALASPGPEVTYRFYVQNLDRIVNAYRRSNPGIAIALCTLASRWPQGKREQFDDRQGHVWWMEKHSLGPDEAASALARFNELLRKFAQSHSLVLVDVERAFEDLDRAEMFWDFAHLHPEGYELLAELMYEALRHAGAITGEPSPRREELLREYRRTDVVG